jgi:hypothetical protein
MEEELCIDAEKYMPVFVLGISKASISWMIELINGYNEDLWVLVCSLKDSHGSEAGWNLNSSFVKSDEL